MKNPNINPVAIYTNADLQKKQILEENKAKSGIYRWTNLLNGNSYIGSSVNLEIRLRNYYSNSYLSHHKNLAINRALLNHGYSNFSLEIIEYCEKEKAVSREQYYMDFLKPEYNILPTAGSSLGFRHSEETLIKMRDRKHTEETLIKMRGRKNSEETLIKMRVSALYRKNYEENRKKMSEIHKGKVLSEETKTKMSLYHPKRMRIEVTDLVLNTSAVFNSIRGAAKALNTSHTAIIKNIDSKKQKPYKGRYVFRKIN